MFELLIVVALISTVVLMVGLFKVLLGLVFLPFKILGAFLSIVLSLVVGILGLVLAVVFVPVLAVVLIPVLIVGTLVALPVLCLCGLLKLVF